MPCTVVKGIMLNEQEPKLRKERWEDEESCSCFFQEKQSKNDDLLVKSSSLTCLPMIIIKL